MRKIVLISLALVNMTCAVLEGLVENLPPQFIQANGLLTIVCAGVFLIWALKIQAERFREEKSVQRQVPE